MTGAAHLSHTPVLRLEALRALALKEGDTVVDCTMGGGGHALGFLEATGPTGKLVGIDKDPQALQVAGRALNRFQGRVSLVHDDFRHVDEVLRTLNVPKADSVFMDLGVSSFQLEGAERGFSFQVNGPLDMRMDPSSRLKAQEIVNHWELNALADVLKNYGEIPNARFVAKAIVRARPLRDTFSLVQALRRVGRMGRKTLHPATRIFQALRIAVNDELGALQEALPKAVSVLKLHGRMCVISFHSLEDRIVKHFFHRLARSCVCPPGLPMCRCRGKAIFRLVARKAVRPGAAEVAANPRSRSARMRVAEKINENNEES